MELREKIAELLAAEYNGPPSEHCTAADAILDLPEIKEALAHTCRDEELTPEQVALVGMVYGGKPKAIRITDD